MNYKTQKYDEAIKKCRELIAIMTELIPCSKDVTETMEVVTISGKINDALEKLKALRPI